MTNRYGNKGEKITGGACKQFRHNVCGLYCNTVPRKKRAKRWAEWFYQHRIHPVANMCNKSAYGSALKVFTLLLPEEDVIPTGATRTLESAGLQPARTPPLAYPGDNNDVAV